MDSITEESNLTDGEGESTLILGEPLSPRLDRDRYSYGEELELEGQEGEEEEPRGSTDTARWPCASFSPVDGYPSRL